MIQSMHALARARLINRDSIALVVKRLTQSRIRALLRWFRSATGGASGTALVARAPLFDTIVQRCVDDVSRSRGAPRSCALALFGCGLAAAFEWRARRESSTPFPRAGSLDGLLRALESFEFSLDDASGAKDEFDPIALGRAACALDPRIDVVIQALHRLAESLDLGMTRRGAAATAARLGASSRFLVFAGMVAAGVSVPARSPANRRSRVDEARSSAPKH